MAGQDAGSTRIKRQRIVNAKLSAEISNRTIRCDLQFAEGPADALSHVRLKPFLDASHALEVNRIRRCFRQTKLRRFREQSPRVVLAVFPKLRLQVAKDL